MVSCAPRDGSSNESDRDPAGLTETRDPQRGGGATGGAVEQRGTGVDVRVWVVSPSTGEEIAVEPVPTGPRLGASAILPEPAGARGGSGTTGAPGVGDTGPAADEGATNRPFANAPRPPQPPKRGGSMRPRAAADAQAILEGLRGEFDQSALDPALVETWARNGLRVVRVPADRVPIVRTRLGLIAPEAQQLIGFSSRRVSVARGAAFEQSEAIELDSGVLTLESGHLRMLLRSWPVPKEAPAARVEARGARTNRAASLPGAMVRVEVTPQAVREAVGRVVPRDAEGNPMAGLSPSQSVATEDAGSMFARLAFEASMDAGDALIMFPIERDGVRPGEAGGAAQAMDTLGASQATDNEPANGAAPQDTTSSAPAIVRRGDVGPAVPELPTLGEAMLTDKLSRNPRGDRLVLVLIANPPATYTLLR